MKRKECEHFWTAPIRKWTDRNRWMQQCLICNRWKGCAIPLDAPRMLSPGTRKMGQWW